MREHMVGKLIAFRDAGEGDELASGSVLVEVTEFRNSGEIEIAFTAPVPGKPRLYLTVSLPELIEIAMQKHGTDG